MLLNLPFEHGHSGFEFKKMQPTIKLQKIDKEKKTTHIFHSLFVSFAPEQASLDIRKASPSPQWNKGSSESGHPMTSLRPTLIHIFIHLLHTSTTHTLTRLCILTVAPTEVRSLHCVEHFPSGDPPLLTTDTFLPRVSAASHSNICQTWKTKRRLVLQKSWEDRK